MNEDSLYFVSVASNNFKKNECRKLMNEIDNTETTETGIGETIKVLKKSSTGKTLCKVIEAILLTVSASLRTALVLIAMAIMVLLK